MTKIYTIWTNADLPVDVAAALRERIAPHRLLYATEMNALNLAASPIDPRLAEADIAFGQPDVTQLLQLANIRWTHLTTAGYTAYDRADLRATLRERGARLTNSSGVYDEPCAQHAAAMMLAFARELPAALVTQLGDRAWPQAERRVKSRLLNGQTALLLGYGAIGLRLAEMLAPYNMNIIGVRREPRGDEPIPMIRQAQLDEYLPQADHVVNLLPANDSTIKLMDARRFALMKPGAYFYNIGRGVTVNQPDLIEALQTGHLGAAYLDVTDPEPLPPDHPLWRAPNCWITPHSAGGQDREFWALIDHFLANLQRFVNDEPLRNQVI